MELNDNNYTEFMKYLSNKFIVGNYKLQRETLRKKVI